MIVEIAAYIGPHGEAGKLCALLITPYRVSRLLLVNVSFKCAEIG